MALKGFLASGFQKLIGASRLKGANEQYLGEPNDQLATFTVSPRRLTNTLVYGDNVIRCDAGAGGVYGNADALFATTPTFPCRVQLVNTGSDIVQISRDGSVVGSLRSNIDVVIAPKCSVTLCYDTVSQRWFLDYAQANFMQKVTKTVTSLTTTIDLSTETAPFLAVQIFMSTRDVECNINAITPSTAITSGDVPQVLFIYALETPYGADGIVLQQDTTNSVTNGLMLNGDYLVGKFSSLLLMYTGTKWIEISRNMTQY